MQRWMLGLALALWLAGCSDDGNPMAAGSGAPDGSGGATAGSGAGGGSGGVTATGGSAGGGGSGGSGGAIASDAGPDASEQPADAAIDAGPVSRGPFDVPELPFPIEPGEPITAPNLQWSFVGFPDSRCANGTPTGIAINPIEGAQGILVFMQGGGACWDANMCLVDHTSVHLDDTVDEAVVLSEAASLSGLFDHANDANPFKDYAYVYIPYCTGDLHIGYRENTYEGPGGAETVHHKGGRNVELYLERLLATFPDVSRIVVSGISAGGYGSTLNWWRYQAAFPNARVDVLDDAGLIVDPPDDRWSTMVEAWGMALPPGCAACAERLSAFMPHYGRYLVAPRRYALVGFLGDAVIGQYFGLTSEQIGDQLLALRETAADNQKTFFLSGTQHSIIGEAAFTMASDGSSFLPWLIQLASDDPAWDHAGP